MTKAVGVRELKTWLCRYLREVRRGRTIVVTDRGKPIAELRPICALGSGREAPLERLIASCLYVRRHIEGVRLLAFDARLNDAARAEGIPLVAAT